MKKVLEKFPIILYLGINNLFLYKYGIRQDLINIFFLIAIFNSLIFFVYFLSRKLNKEYYLKFIFYFVVITFFCLTIGINIFVEGKSLNVDRWSAMSVSINALLENKYPYSALDHLNQGSSNLPSLLLIGLPFYLLGNIGFLQSFCFLFFSYLIHKTIRNFKAKLLGILLLVFSVFYLWEIYVKSDLMSNFILILGFILLSNQQKNHFKKPVLLGVFSSLLFYTRIVSIIPLSLFLFKSFLQTTLNKKIIYAISFLLTLTLLTYLVFRNYPSFEILTSHNPFSLQKKSSQLPLIISLFTILIPFYYSTKAKNLNDIIKYCIIFLSIPIIVSFTKTIVNQGFNKIIVEFSFDISYFNIITPFIIYYIAMEYDKKQIKLSNQTT